MAETAEIVEPQQEAQVAAPVTETTPVVATTPATEAATSPTPEAAATETPETPVVETPTATAPTTKTIDELLSEQGLSADEIKEFKEAKQKQKEEAEKPLREQRQWAETVKYGVDKGLITKEDLLAADKVSATPDKDLVFDKFKSEYKNENGLEGEELQDEIEAAFTEEYGLDAVSDRAKQRAESLLKQEADNLRASVLNKVKAVEAEYNKTKSVIGFSEQHKSLFSEITKAPITQVVKVGDEDLTIEVPFEVTEEEIVASLKSEQGAPLLNLMYSTYSDNPELAGEMYKQYVQSVAMNKNLISKVIEQVSAKVDAQAKLKYSIGAQQPFNRQTVENAKANGMMTETEAYRILVAQ